MCVLYAALRRFRVDQIDMVSAGNKSCRVRYTRVEELLINLDLHVQSKDDRMHIKIFNNVPKSSMLWFDVQVPARASF